MAAAVAAGTATLPLRFLATFVVEVFLCEAAGEVEGEAEAEDPPCGARLLGALLARRACPVLG